MGRRCANSKIDGIKIPKEDRWWAIPTGSAIGCELMDIMREQNGI